MSTASPYVVQIRPSAEKEILALPQEMIIRVRNAIRALADDPRPHGSLKLKGLPGYRIRVGRYRVVYRIDDGKRLVGIRSVGHRKDVYRD